ncbi:MAG: amino acid ABC transporter permease, partial [Muribaculaceae bacterium]|nr:amino acid ABC transporter permease [Muribaculaceae bacterium]
MVIMVVCLCLVGCGGGTHDARLTAINDSTTVNPERAVAALDTIDVATLSDRDRHYYDLLTVKARDKAYITHTSDSLILSVIDYYRSRDSRHLPEALYYGGRV